MCNVMIVKSDGSIMIDTLQLVLRIYNIMVGTEALKAFQLSQLQQIISIYPYLINCKKCYKRSCVWSIIVW